MNIILANYKSIVFDFGKKIILLFLLITTISSSQITFQKIFGGVEEEECDAVVQTSDGGYILGGFTASFNVEYFDFYLAKTDADGDTIWTKTSGGLWQEEIADVEETADGGYAAVGYTYSFGAGSNPNIYFIKTDANSLISDVEDHNNGNEIHFQLKQNYPNPYNPSTIIQYAVSSGQFITLKVYDVLGNEIETLINEEKPAGTYELAWYAASLPSGVYFYQLRAGSFVETKKMLLLK